MWRLGTIAFIFAGSLTVLYLLANWTAQVSLDIVNYTSAVWQKIYKFSITELLILHFVFR